MRSVTGRKLAACFVLLAGAAIVQMLSLPSAAHAQQLKDKGQDVLHLQLDGIDDDLATSSLGAADIQSGTAPAVPSPPTAEELGRLAIWNNFRALIDPTSGGGCGTFYLDLIAFDRAEVFIPGGSRAGSGSPGRRSKTE